ncbi:uncharacterized protein [Littorina saxatilis]|uniref:uncharacterized protein isoform X2 n=1 Tax=Littorina saxatilis TaxID=31220 RepID=UPI0038B603CE
MDTPALWDVKDTQHLLNTDPADNSSQTNNESKPWYHSPLFDKPVTGYYNRATQSNLSLNLPFGQSPPVSHLGRTDQWVSAIDIAPSPAPVSGGHHWSSLADIANTHHHDQPNKNHHNGDQGIYSELHTPWQEGWPDKEQDKSSSAVLQNGAGDLKPLPSLPGNQTFHHYGNGGFLHSLDGSMSADHPEVLKPEEYLSGLQVEKGYSVEYAHAPCGRCTRVVTSLLVLMGLAIVALAAALTVSVLTKKDSAAAQASVDGIPVVRAAMTLKILNMNFTSGMADTGSEEFSSIAAPYSTELDRLFLSSPLAEVYRGNKVTSLGSGSIITSAELLFLDTGKVKDSGVVQNVISSAERASQWKQSDAREMGQFVVCSDCINVDLDFTRVRELPPRPVVEGTNSSTSSPGKSSASTSTDGSSGSQAGVTDFELTTLVTPPNVVLRNTTPFLSDGHFVIACDVTHASDWSLLSVEFKPDNFTSKEPPILLATLRRNSPTSPEVAESVRPRIFAFPDTSTESVGLVVNVTSVTCADRGDYWCRLKMKDGRELSDFGRVGILELPTKPAIKETWSSQTWDATPIYSCSAKLGYPPGKLTLSVANDGGSNLRPISGHVSDGIDCEARAEVQVSSLDSGLLGNASRLVCQLFSQHLQLLDSTEYSVSHEIVLARKLEIQTKSASINDGLAAVRCRLLYLQKWTRITLLKMTSDGKSEEVMSLSRDGKIVWTDFRLRHRTLVTSDVRDTLAEFSVFIFSIKCSDEALYACAVEADVAMTPPLAILNVTATPTKPELTVPLDVTENDEDPFPVTCKAKVGRPEGKLVLTAKHQNETDFREMTFNEQTISPMSCTTEVRGIFHASADALRNGSSVSCHVVPHEALRDLVDTVSTATVVNILPGDLCAGRQDRKIPYPTDCRHFIQCKGDVITNVSRCPDGFCFDTNVGMCSDPVSTQSEQESTASPCYPDKDLTLPDPHQCSSYIQCSKGKEAIKYCPAGQLYVTATSCSPDVTETHCYKTLDMSVWLVTNSTDIP